MNTYDLILFDLDGTLVETAAEICDALNDTLAQFNRPGVPEEQVERWIGHGTRELLVRALARADQRDPEEVRGSEEFARIIAAFDPHYERRCGTRSRLYPHVAQVLAALRGHGVRLAVVTNKEGRHTRTVLAAHGLTALLDHVISGDSLPTKKPDPAGVQDCLTRFGVSARRTLFVGDSSIDVATARNAGVAVWALPYGYNMGQPIAASQPDRLIDDLSALLATVSDPG